MLKKKNNYKYNHSINKLVSKWYFNSYQSFDRIKKEMITKKYMGVSDLQSSLTKNWRLKKKKVYIYSCL